MKKIGLIIITAIVTLACETKRKPESVWEYNQWVPIIYKEGQDTNYWYLNKDTVYSGQLFKAKMFMPLKEFYDSAGQNIILKNQEMSFVVQGYNLNEFLTVKGDTGFLAIPIDSVLNRLAVDSTIWRAWIKPTNDTTYTISGFWYLKRNTK